MYSGRELVPLNSVIGNWGAASFIKRVQNGSISVGASGVGTAIITEVDTQNSIVLYQGFSTTDGSQGAHRVLTELTLTNSTTVTANKRDLNTTTVVKFTVLEFLPGFFKSIQRGRIFPLASTTATISMVNTNKAIVNFTGASADETINSRDFTHVVLTNGTTVTVTRNDNSGNATLSYEVWEFF